MPALHYEFYFLKSLFATVTVEVAVLMLISIFMLGIKKPIPLLRMAFLCACASLLTLPYLWFLYPAFIKDRIAYILFSELTAFIVEAIFYAFVFRLKWYQPWLISLTCNLFSYVFGLIFIH